MAGCDASSLCCSSSPAAPSRPPAPRSRSPALNTWPSCPTRGRCPGATPVATLWARTPRGWQAEGQVQAVAPGDAARVDAEGRLWVGGALTADAVLPDLQVGLDGTLYYPRRRAPRHRRLAAAAGRHARAGHHRWPQRPAVPAPRWAAALISGAGGVAGFVDGRRLTNLAGRVDGAFIPVPAFPAETRFEDGRVTYDAGQARWWLDPTTGEAGKL
ncbi:MAG: hypothetical protein R3F43_31050 [bacterium]